MLRTASFSSSRGTDGDTDDGSKVRQSLESVFSHISHSSHSPSLLKQLNVLRAEERLTDIHLLTDDGQQFPCHRVVLAAACPYFSAMFASGMGEAHADQVTLHDMAGPVLHQFVDYCYTGCLTLTGANVQTVAEAASFLQFTAIEEECVQFLHNRLDATNSLETEQVANRLFNRQLSAQAHDFSVGNFTNVTFSPDFLKFSQEEVEKFISKGVGVDAEEEVYEAVMRWVYHDEEERKGVLIYLMEKLLFEVMGESYVLEIAAKEPLLQEHGNCMAIVKKARSFQTTQRSPNTRNSCSEIQSKAQAMRNYSEVIVLIGNFTYHVEGSNQQSSSLLMYDPKNYKWDEMFGSPFRDSGSEFATAATAMGNDIVVTTNHHRTWLFLTGQTKWSLLTSRMEGRNGGCLVTLQNDAYILGGLKPGEATRVTSVQRFDWASNQWVDVEPLPAGLIHTSAIACLGKIYVIGNTSGSRYVSEMVCYSPLRESWVDCPPLPSRLMRPKVVAVDGKLYILGHQSDSTMAMLCFDVKKQEWTALEGPMVARHSAAFAVCNGKLFLLGGRVLSSDFTETEEFTIECYDPESEIWSLHGDALFTLEDHQEVTVLNPAFPPARYLGPKEH